MTERDNPTKCFPHNWLLTRCSWNCLETLKLRLRKYADENIIVGGDLNYCCVTPEDKQWGRPKEQKQ